MAGGTFVQNRYHRQMLLPGIGQAGQQRLAEARVLLVGCGALGSVVADQLARAGVGFLRIVDRDVVEVTNLQRQVLFDEGDAQAGAAKAAAAAERLRQINSGIAVEARVMDLHAGNVDSLAEGMHLLIDGTDNIETRYLLNDFAVKNGVRWIYGACVGCEGRAMAILPGKTACLRCLFPTPPAPGELPTCDTAGVLAAAANVVASAQCSMAIKLLTGNESAVANHMLAFDLWNDRFHRFSMAEARREDCACCGRRSFEFLDRSSRDRTAALCGRNAVQISPAAGGEMDLGMLAERLAAAGEVRRNEYFVRCELQEAEGITLTAFRDGRLIVQGTADVAKARSLAARYIGQ